jgi:carotenoid cleavage dioxygenase
MAGHFRGTNGLSKSASAFSDAPQFSGFMKPCRFEGEIGSLEVDGEIPSELDGCFYRVMPDPQLPSMFPDDPVSRRTALGEDISLMKGIVV